MSSAAHPLRDLELEHLSVLSVHLVPSWILVSCEERRDHVCLPIHHFLFDLVSGCEKPYFLYRKALIRGICHSKPMPSLLEWHRHSSPFFPYISFAVLWLGSKKEKDRTKCFSKSCDLKGEDNINYLEQYCEFPQGGCRNLSKELHAPRRDLYSVACSVWDNQNRLQSLAPG